jgi:hypothetical protein
MNRNDAEDLARAYCLRNVKNLQVYGRGSRAQAERAALAEAQARYGENLTAAALTRIRKALRNARPPKGLQELLTLTR